MSLVVAFALLAAAPGAVVTRPVASMYSAPSTSSDVVSQAIFGTTVVLLEEKPGWARVRTPDDYTGWVETAAFRKLRAGEEPYASAGTVAQVESLFANVYVEPDVTTRAPLMTLPYEARVKVASEPEKDERRWVEVRLPDGSVAWVHRGDLTFERRPLTVQAAVALAKRLLGLPYLWGGTSTFGYDCSGLTQMLYRRLGAGIPRDAGPQAQWKGFTPVERTSLRPGDLLFFGKSAGKITHCGMYIGGGDFLHATTYRTPVVQISRLDEPHWSTLLLSCRRPK